MSQQGWGAPPPTPPGWGQAPYPAYGAPVQQQTDGMAVGALICAIGAYVVCPVVLAIVALVLAQNARNHIDESGGRVGGAGLVTAARVIAWIHLAITMLVLLGIAIAGFALGARG